MTDVPDPEDVNWKNPDACPFCGASLTDGDVVFADHTDANPDCQARFEAWHENAADDAGGEWSG